MKKSLGTATLCLASMFLIPAQVANAEGNTPSPASTGAHISDSQRAAAERAGVDTTAPEVISNNGMTMISDGSSWVITQDEQGAEQARTANIVSIGACAGRFFDIRKVNNTLEWGAENSCVSLRSQDVYPHSLTVTLRQGNTSMLAYKMYNKRTNSSTTPYSTVVRVFKSEQCADTNQHDFDMTVTVIVHGTKFGPKVSPDSRWSCGLK